MPVDIEYPTSSDAVGPTFRAGGDYETNLKSTLPTGSKVVCKVLDMSTTPPTELSDKFDDLFNDPAIGDWEVEHILPVGTNVADCKITAELFVGSTSDGTDDVENLEIKAMAAMTLFTILP